MPGTRPLKTAAGAAVVLIAGIAIGIHHARGAAARRSLLDGVAREAPHGTQGDVRFSVTAAPGPCRDAATGDGRCPDPPVPSAAALALSARAGKAVRAGTTDPRTLHAAALVEILWPDSAGRSLLRAISYLQTAAVLAEHPAPVLADLAGAYLVRAEHTRSPRDLAQALEAAERALELDSANVAARYNDALALDRLGLGRQAVRGWTRYVAADSTSGWAGEARRRLRANSTVAVQPRPGPAAPAGEFAAWAARDPQPGLEHAWDVVLGDWAAATLAGDTTAAAASLGRAAAMGAALVRRGGDASLADAVAAIRRVAGDHAATRRLAGAHAAYAEGRKAFLAVDYRRSLPPLRRAAATGSPPLTGWSNVAVASSLVYLSPESVVRVPAAVAVDSVRYPAMAGRAHWARGVALQRLGRLEHALGEFHAAAPLFTRAGETGHTVDMLLMAGESEANMGRTDAGYASLHEATLALRGLDASLSLHNVVVLTANALAADGLYRAALRVQDEGVAAAEGLDGAYLAEALLNRARLRLAAGQHDVSADVEPARRVILALDAGSYPRRWLESDLLQTEAGTALHGGASRAGATLDPVVEFFATNPLRLIPALLARADARQTQGHADSAESDLRRAIAVLEVQRDSMSSARLRSSLFDVSQRVFDRLTMLSVSAGRPAEALAVAERGRVSFAPVGRHGAGPAARPRSPPGQVALELALIGDTLLAWTVSDTAVHLERRTLPRAALLRVVERARSARDTAALGELYDRLVRPVEAHLGAAGTPLVLITDGELAGVPFAALRDRRHGGYLVEGHTLRFAASLADASRPARAPVPGEPVLLVADPAFVPGHFPELARLEGAAGEVRSVEQDYPGSRVLSGAQATLPALKPLLARAAVVHYAGHAVFDDERPEQSYLVLAPAPGGAPDRLAADTIERMNLRKTRLVVLSACLTARGQGGRSGGFAGLAGAFLAAGAQGVVGSLWPLDDSATRPLMEGFHAAYRRSGDAAAALRDSQLRMLRSRDPALAAPSAWAGVRYMGS